MKISIVIPTRKSARFIWQVLDSLEGQTHKDIDVHVIDDCSEDHEQLGLAVRIHARRYPVELHHSMGHRGAAAARNIGIVHSGGERILFIDDDCICPRNLVAAHASDDPVALIGFRRHVLESELRPSWQHDPEEIKNWIHDSRWPRRYVLEEFCKKHDPQLHNYVHTCHVSYPSLVLRQVGGFWEKFVGSGFEDLELALRVQRFKTPFKVLHEPFVYHIQHPQDIHQRRNVKINRDLLEQTRRSFNLTVHPAEPASKRLRRKA